LKNSSIEVSSCRMLALVDTVPTSCVFVCDAFYDTLRNIYIGEYQNQEVKNAPTARYQSIRASAVQAICHKERYISRGMV